MNKSTDTGTEAPVNQGPESTEAKNVAIQILKNRTKVGGMICAAGPLDFPVTKTMADALVAAGLATITGIWA